MPSPVLCKISGGIFTVVIAIVVAVTVAVMLKFSNDAYERGKIKGEELGAAMGGLGEAASVISTRYTEQSTGLVDANTALGAAYQEDNVKCYSPQLSVRTTQYLRTVAAMLSVAARGGGLQRSWVSYKIPGGDAAHAWGECGCELVGPAVQCFWSNATGRFTVMGTDVTRVISVDTNPRYGQSPEGTEVQALRTGDKGSLWTAPRMVTTGVPAIDHVMGLTYTAGGMPELATTVRFRLAPFQAQVSAEPALSHSELLLIGTANGGTFLASNHISYADATTTLATMTVANGTTSARVNVLANIVAEKTKGFKPEASTDFYSGSKPVTFAHAGMLYNVRAAMNGALLLIQRSPQVEDVGQVAAAVTACMTVVTQLTMTLKNSYVSNNVDCANTEAGLEAMRFFMEASMATMDEFNATVAYVYAVYRASRGTGGAEDVWGACGCGRLDEKAHSCSTVNATGYYYHWADAAMTRRIGPIEPDWNVAHEEYVQHIMQLTRADQGGKWIKSSTYRDPTTGVVLTLATFAVPFAFDATGKALKAMAVDVSFPDWAAFLQRWNGHDNEIALIDTRDDGNIMADSRTAFPEGGIYVPTATPNSTFNALMSELVRQQKTYAGLASFSDANATLYNTAPAGPHFEVVELVLPQQQPAWFNTDGLTTKNAKSRLNAAVANIKDEAAEIRKMFTSSEKLVMGIMIAASFVAILLDKLLLLILSLGGSKRPAGDEYYDPEETSVSYSKE